MGSAKVSAAKPQLPMEKKSIKTPLLTSFKNLFKDKKKEKAKYEKEIEVEKKPKDDKPKDVKPNNETVANILETFKNLNIEDSGLVGKKPKDDKPKDVKPNDETVSNIIETFKNLDIEDSGIIEITNERTISESEDDFSDFTFKVIEDDRIRHSSEDSGFAEAKDDGLTSPGAKEHDVQFSLRLKEDAGLKYKKEDTIKKRRNHEIRISRAPIRNKINDYKVQPYSTGHNELDSFRQISQVNKHALSGGQVIVNATPTPDNYDEFDNALKEVEKIFQTSTNQSEYWQDVLDLIGRDSQTEQQHQNIETEEILKEFNDFVSIEQTFEIDVVPNAVPIPNAVEEFSASQHLPNFEDSFEINNSLLSFENVTDNSKGFIFPTPPRSENVPSPMSESQASFYPTTNWDNNLSPERSSPVYNSDYEKYQDISQYEELSPISEVKDKKRERTSSISSMTMKNFKDLQKDICNEFSKKDCCQIDRKSCKEIFDEHISKLKPIEKTNLCFKVSKMDLKTAYGVLHHVLLNLSTRNEQEDLQCVLFALICQRVLAQSPALFVGDFGLSLLKSAVMRCPHRPVLTRFIVHYVYAALRQTGSRTAAAQECVFDEVDAQGDNLIIACARGGDAYALVLAEITRTDTRGDLPPLFRIHHANTDGYTALHVACSLHSAAAPRLHTIHVLLEHAHADVWKGDGKGGDTALHLAVNSVNCDLRVILMLFKPLDRKMWKKFAHIRNMSSVTPIEYARSAKSSTTRQNYPQEVPEFLKKCR